MVGITNGVSMRQYLTRTGDYQEEVPGMAD